MITWGIFAALTACVAKVPWHFHTGSGSCSAWPRPGFYPGVIVYLTHWFPSKTRPVAGPGLLLHGHAPWPSSSARS